MKERDRQARRDTGCTDRDTFGTAAGADVFGVRNRTASAIDMTADLDYQWAQR